MAVKNDKLKSPLTMKHNFLWTNKTPNLTDNVLDSLVRKKNKTKKKTPTKVLSDATQVTVKQPATSVLQPVGVSDIIVEYRPLGCFGKSTFGDK